ncbi:PREDICTED: thionin [Prunus dulcis]|uniref:PREDICTED: thionin n=1 Tax=Prunus dulcis TaxID=3755 RepID=A0A5E4GD66_PRUDU|nr:thionin-like protein 2 [Prunus dulcis]KAI5337146.1 hypothetical protein L3X38_016415 [Prunus dulcis]VVA37754.1 PREDICTED: thionin [Prunus dulcis]
MEKKGVNMGAAMASLVLLVTLMGRSTAVDNPDCYANCLPKCVKGSVFGTITCAGTCIAQCLAISPSLLSVPKDDHYFCKLGCASSMCASLIDTENPEMGKVGDCVDSCSEKCSISSALPHN